MLYYISQYPLVEQKLREEIKKHMVDDDYSYDNLKNLVYLEMILKESRRMCCPATGTFLREVKKNHYFSKIPVSKGTIISALHTGNHFNPRFFKDPELFIPERWEKERTDLHPFTFGGFGGGTRGCIGKNLSLL